MNRATLVIELSTFWHAGTGRGMSLSLDAVARRDRRGLPIVPARTIKGLLRDAVLQAEKLAWVDDGTCVRLFGDAESPGIVLVSPARLEGPLADALVAQPERRGHLFRTLFSTAIEDATGTALAKSLRSSEVTIPLVLESALSGSAADGWVADLETALPLFRSLGSHRNRGLGRIARLTIRTKEAAA